MLEVFITNAESYLNRALYHAMKIINANSKTDILNAEYCMGQFMAYMDMIEITDFDKFIEIGERTMETRTMILEAIDKLYR